MIILLSYAVRKVYGDAEAAAICVGRSKEIYAAGFILLPISADILRTSVLFPDCLAPFKKTTGLTFKASVIRGVIYLGIIFIADSCKSKDYLYNFKSPFLFLQKIAHIIKIQRIITRISR